MSSADNSPRLPRLSGSNKHIYQQGDDEEIPFYVPANFEIFQLKEQQKRRAKQKKEEEAQKGIWEKGIKVPMAGKLKSLWKIEEEQPAEVEPQMNIVDAAKSAIKNRVRQKESRRVFVEKKREMFLFQKLIDKKRKQINKFEEMTRLHERGLQKAEEMLEEDLEQFNEFLDENKNNCRNTIKKAEEEAQKKQAKIQIIKLKNEQKADLFTKNIQKLETLQQLQKYKTFMQEITPKESAQKKEKKAAGKKGKTMFDSYNINIDEDFRRVLEESEDENDMWFSKPEQLESQIESLEEKNLYLIGNNKDIEQKIENVSKKKNQVKNSKDALVKTINKNKEDLQAKINVLNEDIRRLRNNKIDDETPILLAKLEEEISLQYNQFVQEGGQPAKKDFVNGVDVLREMEAKIEYFIKEINQLKTNPDTKDIFIKTEKSIRETRINKTKNENEILRQKMEKYKAQALRREKVQKRQGRPIMKKSMLFKEEVQQEVKQEISQEEIERILYFT